MAGEKEFSAFDYVIFALLLAVSAAIGIFYGFFGKKQKSSKDLLVANREMGVKQNKFKTILRILNNNNDVLIK